MAIRPVQIIGFQPDLAPDTPGVLVSSSQCLPTDRGIGNGWGISSASDSVAGTATSGYEFTSISGSLPTAVIGIGTKLYKNSGGTLTDISGSAYVVNTGWTFATYGNTLLAANKGDRLQASTLLGTFADAFADAPKATKVIVAGPATRPFAILFDYDDGTDTPHGIYWNPDPTLTWATSISTQVGKVSVVDINGKFTAAVAYRDGAIAFKRNAMYEGQYVGGSDMWVWKRISSDIGCYGPNAVVSANDVIYFADRTGLWEYDGSYPRPMPGAIHQWLAGQFQSLGNAHGLVLTWDATKHLLWVRYRDSFLGNIGSHIVFNPRSQLWTLYGTLTDGTTVLGRLIGPNYAVLGVGSTVYSLTKSALNGAASALTLNAIGSEYGMVTMRSLRPHWLQGPLDTDVDWASCTLYHGPTMRNISSAQVTMNFATPGRFDKVKTARYIQPSISVIAGTAWEMDRYSTDGQPAGQE